MTIKIPPPDIWDKILSFFGKKRALFIPPDNEKYAYKIARRENFVCALLRPRRKELSDGWGYWDIDYQKALYKIRKNA